MNSQPSTPGDGVLHGVDLVDVERVALMRARHGQRFLDRCFTEGEQAYCLASSKRADEHFAARFAAKEAVVKALGTGVRHGICWTDIEVVRNPSGKPELVLRGVASEQAASLGVNAWVISLSHTSRQAIASVIATVRPAAGPKVGAVGRATGNASPDVDRKPL